MKENELMAIFHALPDAEKVGILLRALQIKTMYQTINEAILLASGYYRNIDKMGEWIRNEGDRNN